MLPRRKGSSSRSGRSDVVIKVKFTSRDGKSLDTFEQNVTVTPIVISFIGETPQYDTGTGPQSISFVDGPDSTHGLQATTIEGENAMQLYAEVYAGGLGIKFAQNDLGEFNGANRGGAGWSYSSGTTANLLPLPGSVLTFPVLDTSGGYDPTLLNPINPHDPVNPDDFPLAMSDAPTTGYPTDGNGNPLTPGMTTLVDEKVKFRTYLVVEYDDSNNVVLRNYNNNPQTTWARKTLFTIGYVDWTVNFYSTGTEILDPDGVVPGSFVRSNIDIFNTNPPRISDAQRWVVTGP